jgi:hypothetical protein
MSATDAAEALAPADRWPRVKQLRKEGRLADAMAILDGLCREQPREQRFAVCMAEMLLQTDRPADAAPHLRRVRDLDPQDPAQLELLTRLEARQELLSLNAAGDYEGVIAAYHRRVRETPSVMRRIEEWTPIVNGAGEALYQANGEHAGPYAQAIADEVRERGVAVRSLLDLPGGGEILADLQAVARATNDWTVPGKPHFFKAIREEEAKVDHPVMRGGLHPGMLEIANGFYGLYSRLASANIVLTRTDGSDERVRRGSEGWHRDPEDTPMFKAFIYLNDVEQIGDGPFQYIPESRPGGKYEYLMPRFGRGVYDKEYKTKPDWAQTDQEVDPADVVTVLGKAGTMFFGDTCAFHRGGYCTVKDRYMTTYVYQRPGSQYPSYIQTELSDPNAPAAVRMAVAPL